MKKLLLALTTATSLIASQAFADNAKSFSGLNIQLGSGYQHSNGQFQNINGGRSATEASDENAPLIFGIGYTTDFANDFTLGAIFEYNAIKSKAGFYDFNDGVLNSTNDGNIKFKNQYTFALTPGYAFDKSTLGYAKIGYASSKAIVSYPDGDPNDKYSLNGWVFGLGAKKLINDNVYVYGEFNYTKNNDKGVSETITSGNTTTTVTGELNSDLYNGIVGVGFKF